MSLTLRRLVMTTAATLSAFALAACGSSSMSDTGSSASAAGSTITKDDALAAKVPDKIKTAGKIVVGIDPTYAPNDFLDADGKTVKGMDVDVFNAVAAKLGLKTEYVAASFDTIILGVDSGKYDAGVSSFTINPDRMSKVNMISYFNAGSQWVTQKGNPKKVDIENACGLNVGAQKGVVQIDDLNARSKKCTDAGKKAINIVIDDDQGKVTANVASGKVDAMVADSPISLYAVKQSSDKLEALGTVYDAAPYGFVVAKSQTDFAEAIAGALKALDTSGDYKKALATWGQETGGIADFAVNPVK